jgi:hypothetical protein
MSLTWPKGRIVRQLELAHLMGLETVRAPDALDRTDADPDRLGHRRRSPVDRLAVRRTGGEVDHARDHRPIKRRLARGMFCRAAAHRHSTPAFLPFGPAEEGPEMKRAAQGTSKQPLSPGKALK